MRGWPCSHRSAYDHSTDLDDRSLVGVVRDVAHDFLRVWPEAGLKRLDRVAEDVAHADVCGRCTGRAAGEALVDRVVLAGITQPSLDERHVLVPVIFVIEARSGRVGIH